MADSGVNLTVRTQEGPGPDSDHRDSRAKSKSDFGQGAVPPVDCYHRCCGADDKCVPGFPQARRDNHVDPRVGDGRIPSGQQTNRHASLRLGGPAGTLHHPSESSTDHNSTVGRQRRADLLSKSDDRRWGLSSADDCNLCPHDWSA